MITPEVQTANIANEIIAMASQLWSIQNQISQISTAWTNLSAATKLNAFPTAALTTTGGIGSADGSPNVANPINVGVSPGTLVSRAVSANNVAGLLTWLQGVQNCINGQAVSANGAAASLIQLCLS